MCVRSIMRRARVVVRAEAQGAIAKHLHQFAAGAEEQHRAELRIDARTEDQLIALRRIMGCTVTPKNVPRPRAGNGFANLLKSGADCFGRRQVQANAADVAFMRDRFRVQFDDDGVAGLLRDARCDLLGFVSAFGQLRLHRGMP